MPALPDNQHGNVRPVQHALTHAPEDQAADLPETAAAHDDHVGLRLGRGREDLVRRLAPPVLLRHGRVDTVEHLCRLLENRLPGLLEAFFQHAVVDHHIGARPAERDRRNVTGIDQHDFRLLQLAREARRECGRALRVRRPVRGHQDPHHLPTPLTLGGVPLRENRCGRLRRPARRGPCSQHDPCENRHGDYEHPDPAHEHRAPYRTRSNFVQAHHLRSPRVSMRPDRFARGAPRRGTPRFGVPAVLGAAVSAPVRRGSCRFKNTWMMSLALTMPVTRPPPTTGTRRTIWSSISAAISSTGVSSETETESAVMTSRIVPPWRAERSVKLTMPTNCPVPSTTG